MDKQAVNEKGYFKANKPSVIDLYIDETNVSLDLFKSRLKESNYFDEIKDVKVNDDILRCDVKYKGIYFSVYLKIMPNDDIDLKSISQVLVNEEDIEKANNANFYIKTYVDAKHDFVLAYYAQVKVIALLSNRPLLIVDTSQWCIYSKNYIKQVSASNVDIVDSNLFKVKVSDDGSLYTDGLNRFGIKDIEMMKIPKKYIKGCASFLSRLSRYFIEHGQIPNSCKSYVEVFESSYYVCLIDVDVLNEEILNSTFISQEKLDETIEANRMYVSIHVDEEISDCLTNSVEVLEFLLDNTTYYTSQQHFDNEKNLAQETLDATIDFLTNIEDESNLMILARNEEISTDWYYFEKRDGSKFTLKTTDSTLVVDFKDIINWNYKSITPLHAYSLEV